MDLTGVIKQRVNIHGSWRAGYIISDSLIKMIATKIATAPSKYGTLTLNSQGLTIQLPPTADGKPGTCRQIPIDNLRDVSTNQYQRKCLLIVYLDASRKFSVMACSSQDHSSIYDFEKAYKEHSNIRLKNSLLAHQTHNSPNWILRKSPNNSSTDISKMVGDNNDKTIFSTKPSSSTLLLPAQNTHLVENEFGSFQRSNTTGSFRNNSDSISDFEDVFLDDKTIVVHEPEDVARESAGWTTSDGHETFNVNTQTSSFDDNFDMESISSTLTLQSIAPSVDANSPQESVGISSDVYHNRRNSQMISIINIHTAQTNNLQHDIQHDKGGNQVDDFTIRSELSTININDDKDKVGESLNYHFRSCGSQTINTDGITRRYTKKTISRTISNSYREKIEAARKRISDPGPKSKHSDGPVSPSRTDSTDVDSARSSVISNNNRGEHLRMSYPVKRTMSAGHSTVARPSGRTSITSNSTVFKPLGRTFSMSKSTVVRPIEAVYTRSTRPANVILQRPIIVYRPT